MSSPNDYVPSTHAFHHENMTPLVIQAAHSNSNFTPPANSNSATHFNGGGFFLNSNNYDVAMLPLFHHTPQRPAHFNTSFTHQKPIQAEMPKEDLLQTSVDNRSNSFTADGTLPAAQSVYWSRQSQLSPFGVLPHEMTPNHTEEKSSYENALNTHFVSHTLNTLNQLTDCDKKTQIMPKTKESVKKQYMQKPMTEVKLNAPVYNHEEMNFRNGVINHGQAMKLDQSKLINTMYKAKGEELQVTESVNTVPRDYRVFKSPGGFPSSPAPVVKYTGKPSKQYTPKQTAKSPQNSMAIMKTQQRLGGNSSPLLQQKMEFQEDSQSSPISLTSDDINEQHRYSSPSNVIQHGMKESDAEASYMGHMNTIPNSPTGVPSPGYREQQQMQDMNCHGTDKTKVTPPFLKLPYTVANVQNNVAVSEACHSNRKAPFAPLYIMYNNPGSHVNSVAPKRAQEKQMSSQNERQETHQHSQANNVKLNIPQTDNAGMVMSKSQQNGLVGYSSVIMRTERNYEGEEKSDKRRMQWPGSERQIQPSASTIKQVDKVNQMQPTMNDHQHILLGLTERQHSYFDSSPCTSQVTQQTMSGNNMKCSPKSAPKIMYDESRVESQQHQQISQDQMNPYQYVHTGAKSQMSMNSAQIQQPQQPEMTQKAYRKRKPSKNNIQNVVENRVQSAPMSTEYQNRDPPPAHLNMYQQPVQNSNYMMDGARYDMSKMYANNDQFYAQSSHNYNTVANVTGDALQQQQQQSQTVIALHTSPSARVSPSTNPQMRVMSQMPPSLPLSAYFSSFHSSSPHYAHQEYSVNSPDMGQTFGATSEPPSASSSSSPFQESSARTEKELLDSHPRVLVPNIEEEFQFLFDPHLPNFKQIVGTKEEEEMMKPLLKTTFYRKNIDFLASYKKFLDNNCESTETLIDGNSGIMKNWNRPKVYQPVSKEKEELATTPPVVVPKEPIKTVTKEPECNFENDPRYYPLPKSSDKRRLESSSDDEPDEPTKKVSKTPVSAKKPAVEIDKKKVAVKKEKKIKKEEPKRKESKKEAKKEEKLKTKSEKIVKTKQKSEKVATKPKVEKTIEADVHKQSPQQKKKSSKETSKFYY